MQSVPLKIGTKQEGKEPYKVPVNLAESVEEIQSLSRGDMKVVLRCFNRGWRIENQERSGARDKFRAGGTVEEVAAIVANYDPTKVVPRAGRPAAPKEITLPKGKKNFSAQELAELLAKSGIKANISAE